MKKIFYNKLIRDRIPKKIEKKGSECKTRKLSKKNFEIELKKKLSEESIGVRNARTKKELIEELADVMDVCEEIRKIKNISTRDIKKSRKEAQKKKGGFKKRLYLLWSSDDGYKSNESN